MVTQTQSVLRCYVRANALYGKAEKSIDEEEVVEGEVYSHSVFCQVLVFRLRCDKPSQLKRAVKYSL